MQQILFSNKIMNSWLIDNIIHLKAYWVQHSLACTSGLKDIQLHSSKINILQFSKQAQHVYVFAYFPPSTWWVLPSFSFHLLKETFQDYKSHMIDPRVSV